LFHFCGGDDLEKLRCPLSFDTCERRAEIGDACDNSSVTIN